MVKDSKRNYASARRKQTLRSLNMRLKDVESNIKAEETKKLYTAQNETQLVSTSPTVSMLSVINALVQGDKSRNVSGVSYNLQGIGMKFLAHNTSGTPAIIRMAVIRVKSGAALTVSGEDLLTGNASNGLDFSSATEYQRYYCPINRNKYDVVLERTFKIGAKNTTYTSNLDCNKLIRGYKRYKNRKEFINADGEPDTKYVLVGWCVDTNMDNNAITVEITGETVLYYKDN